MIVAFSFFCDFLELEAVEFSCAVFEPDMVFLDFLGAGGSVFFSDA